MSMNKLGGIKSYTTHNIKEKIKDWLMGGWACRDVGKRMNAESMFNYSWTSCYCTKC
jgi:hypothetical protein